MKIFHHITTTNFSTFKNSSKTFTIDGKQLLNNVASSNFELQLHKVGIFNHRNLFQKQHQVGYFWDYPCITFSIYSNQILERCREHVFYASTM